MHHAFGRPVVEFTSHGIGIRFFAVVFFSFFSLHPKSRPFQSRPNSSCEFIDRPNVFYASGILAAKSVRGRCTEGWDCRRASSLLLVVSPSGWLCWQNSVTGINTTPGPCFVCCYCYKRYTVKLIVCTWCQWQLHSYLKKEEKKHGFCCCSRSLHFRR